MVKLNLLTLKISKHFSIHPSRKKTLASLILGVLSSNNVHHQSLARHVDSPNPKAALRKVELFFLQKNYKRKRMLTPLLILLALKESLILVLIEPTGSLAIRTSIISS
jgi:hypothetical protein